MPIEPIKRSVLYPTRSVVSKIFLFFFFGSVILTLGVGLTSFSISKRVIQDKVADTSEQSVMQSAKTLDLVLKNYVDLVLQIVEDEELFPMFNRERVQSIPFVDRASRIRAQQILKQFQGGTHAVNALHILAVDGQMSLSTNTDHPISDNYHLEDWFRRIVEGSRSGEWLDTRLDGYSKKFSQNSFAYGRVIYDSFNDKPQSVILVEIDVLLALSKHIPLELAENGRMLIVNDRNKIILSNKMSELSRDSGILFGKDVNEFPPHEPSRLIDTQQGVEHLTILQRSALTGWYLIATYPIHELIKETNTIYNVTFIAILLAVGAAALLSYLLVLTVGRPLVSLSQLMKEGRMGNLMVRADVRSHDEIGQLGHHFNLLMDKIEHLIESDYKSQILRKEAQIRALQGQINPHFLYNTLQTMGSIAQINDVPDIKSMCKALSNMFRYSIKMKDEWVAISEEIMHVRNYLVIINKRYGDLIRVRFLMDPSLKGYYMPKLILQPIVENAIEHGLIPSKRNKKLIKISITIRGQELFIRIIDNGVGIPNIQVERLKEHLTSINAIYESYKRDSSIGMVNVQTRILLVCGEQYGISLDSRKNVGTRISIRLPVKQGVESDV